MLYCMVTEGYWAFHGGHLVIDCQIAMCTPELTYYCMSTIF